MTSPIVVQTPRGIRADVDFQSPVLGLHSCAAFRMVFPSKVLSPDDPGVPIVPRPSNVEDWDRFVSGYILGNLHNLNFSLGRPNPSSDQPAPPLQDDWKPISPNPPSSEVAILTDTEQTPKGNAASVQQPSPQSLSDTGAADASVRIPPLDDSGSFTDLKSPLSISESVTPIPGVSNQDPEIPDIATADLPDQTVGSPFRSPAKVELNRPNDTPNIVSHANMRKLDDEQNIAAALEEDNQDRPKTAQEREQARRRKSGHRVRAELASPGSVESGTGSDEDNGLNVPVRRKAPRRPRSRGSLPSLRGLSNDGHGHGLAALATGEVTNGLVGGTALSAAGSIGGRLSMDVLLESGTNTSTSISLPDLTYDISAERARVRAFYETHGYLPAPRQPPDAMRRRLRIIRRLGLDKPNPAVHAALDRFSRLAVNMFKTRIAVVSIIAKDRQIFLSQVGLAGKTPELDVSFCCHTIMGTGDECMVVPNAADDWRFAKNPLVDEGKGLIQFYAGAPLRIGTGPKASVIGSLCVIDDKPKTEDQFGEAERLLLKDLAECVISELELLFSQQASVESAKLHQISVDFLRRSLQSRPNERAGHSANSKTTTTTTSSSDSGKRHEGADSRQSNEQLDIYDEACREIRHALDAYAVACVDLTQFHLFFPAYQTTSTGGSSTRHTQNSFPTGSGGSSFIGGIGTDSVGTAGWGMGLEEEGYTKPFEQKRARQTYAVTDPMAPGRTPQILFIPEGAKNVPKSKKAPQDVGNDSLAVLGYSCDHDGFAFNFGTSPVARKIIAEFIASNVKTRKVWYMRDDSEGIAQSINHLMPPGTETSLAMPVFGFDGQVAFAIVACWTDPLYSYPSGALQFVETIAGSLLASVMKEKLHHVERAQLTFAAAASHELRTPLHQINNAAHLLRFALHPSAPASPSLAPLVSPTSHSTFNQGSQTSYAPSQPLLMSIEDRIEALAQLEIIEANGLALSSILENITDTLDVSHSATHSSSQNSGGINDPSKATDLSDVIEQITQEAAEFESKSRRVTGAKGLEDVEIIIEVLPRNRGRWLLTADAGLLTRALTKIIHNACKFTDKGHIHITVQDISHDVVLPAGYDNSIQMSVVSIDVKDTGRGMSAEFLENEVLRPFSKADPFMPGSGLGLGLAHRMIEILGGTLAINSTLKKGTLVHVEAPLKLINDDIDSGQEEFSGDEGDVDDARSPSPVRQDGIYLAGFSEAKDSGTRRVGKSLFRQLKLRLCRVVTELNYASVLIVPEGHFTAEQLGNMLICSRPKAQLFLLGKPTDTPQPLTLGESPNEAVTPGLEHLQSAVITRLTRPLRPSIINHITRPPPPDQVPQLKETYISPVTGGPLTRPSFVDRVASTMSTLTSGSGATVTVSRGELSASRSTVRPEEIVHPSPLQSPYDQPGNDYSQDEESISDIEDHSHPSLRPIMLRERATDPLPTSDSPTISPSQSKIQLSKTSPSPSPNPPLIDRKPSDRSNTSKQSDPSNQSNPSESSGLSIKGLSVVGNTNSASSGTDDIEFGFPYSIDKPDLQQRHTTPATMNIVEEEETLRVMVVEDNPVNRRILTTMLKRTPCRFAEAVDGVDAVQQFSTFRPHLVLMDINMPRKDGFQAASEMRGIERNNGWKRCKIVAVTAMTSEGHRRKGILECGIDEWRTKPVGIAELRIDVERMRVPGVGSPTDPIHQSQKAQQSYPTG
ncbi:hypothetical protein M231_05474 [Tremella mesenterica]|uniref:histidine kinase n=1 Tax=Tremella mesenterica TaxID=5217 RepID=A0A4Q1BHZ5_TREME|nr:hypothetical protein M231_05474 [Tremella mesenterica]